MAANPCPLTAHEGTYLLTCCLPAGHNGDCWCNNITHVDQGSNVSKKK